MGYSQLRERIMPLVCSGMEDQEATSKNIIISELILKSLQSWLYLGDCMLWVKMPCLH